MFHKRDSLQTFREYYCATMYSTMYVVQRSKQVESLTFCGPQLIDRIIQLQVAREEGRWVKKPADFGLSGELPPTPQKSASILRSTWEEGGESSKILSIFMTSQQRNCSSSIPIAFVLRPLMDDEIVILYASVGALSEGPGFGVQGPT